MKVQMLAFIHSVEEIALPATAERKNAFNKHILHVVDCEGSPEFIKFSSDPAKRSLLGTPLGLCHLEIEFKENPYTNPKTGKTTIDRQIINLRTAPYVPASVSVAPPKS